MNGTPVKYAVLLGQQNRLKPEVTRDNKFARLVWARILKGNAEAATATHGDHANPPWQNDAESAIPNIDGFIGKRDIGGNGREYVKPENLLY